jgi:DNA-binding response OmpR family regulator
MVDPRAKINLDGANILLLEQSEHGLEILVQMFHGFGGRNCHKCTSIDEARSVVMRATLDLIVADPNLQAGDGHEFVRWLRTSGLDPNRTVPIIMISANGTKAAVERARDAGASYFLVKPVTPRVLLDRIVRVQTDKRAFVVCDAYAGPDRRFKFEGPPPGVTPRRSTDIKTKLTDTGGPNMSQSDIDALFKPQRASL